MSRDTFRILADLVLVTHFGFVVFVIAGLSIILIGGSRGWECVRNPWFRLAHGGAIAVVVVQAWMGAICPLTSLEMYLRDRAGDATYNGAFIAHWVQELLYYEAPPWAFATAYTLFAIAVLWSWFKFPPRSFHTRRDRQKTK